MATEPAAGYPDGSESKASQSPDAPKVQSVCLLGLTGVGKSATGNTLLGDRENSSFVTSSSTDSVTAVTSSVVGRWRGKGSEVRVVDTPGWLDSGGREVDLANRREMAERLKQLKEVHAFLLLINAADPRINGSAITLVKLLTTLFGKGFLRNLVVGYTHWDYDAASVGDRQDDNDGMEEEEIRNEKKRGINTVFREILGHTYADFPCIFIDNRMNFYNDSQLKRRFRGDEADAAIELDAQFDVLWKVMSTGSPFDCGAVSVRRANRAEEVSRMVPHYLQMGLSDDEAKLNRQLKTGDQDVLFSGWVWYRRQWIFAKLRRQSLRFYDSDASNAMLCSKLSEIDLLGAVCTPTHRLAFSAQPCYFIVHKPPTQTSVAESYRFGVSALDQHRRWISLIMEATQISDGCSRVQELHNSLTGAATLAEYNTAVNSVDQQTIIVPVEWMQQHCSSGVLAQAASQTDSHQDKSVAQLKKDFQREDINFLGEEILHGPGVDDLMERITVRILEEIDASEDDEGRIRACALALARDTLFSCSRTLAGSVALAAVETLFQNRDLVYLVDDGGTHRCPNCLTKIQPGDVVCSSSECGAKVEKWTIDVRVLRSKEKSDALRLVDNASGVCELEGEEGRYGKVDVQRLKAIDFVKGVEIDRKRWIPDEEWESCMTCGLDFSIFLRRRHHCRACGKVVCHVCSQQRILFGAVEQRVCFVCYTTSYLSQLRDKTDELNNEDTDDSDTGGDIGVSMISGNGTTNVAASEDQKAPPAPDETDLDFPCISVTMVQNFKICAEPDLDVIFHLHCRFFRIVRWNGCADAGRVFISIRRP